MNRLKWIAGWALYFLVKGLLPVAKGMLWFRVRSDVLFAHVYGKATDWLCKQTGRSNYWVAKWLLYFGVGSVVFDDLIYILGPKPLTSEFLVFVFLPFWILVAYKASRELIRADASEPSDVVFSGFWTRMMTGNAWFWTFIGMTGTLAAIATLSVPRPQWLALGFAGYAVGHVNRGGKSALQRAKEWLQDRLQVLVPAPVPV
jgi:hypothetical protein